MAVEKEKLIEKIKKLMALSNSPNENEAALAAQKAHAMLAEHNLSLDMINESTDDGKIDKEREETYSSAWQRSLRQYVAKLNFCSYYFVHRYEPAPTRQRGRRRLDQHFYIGKPHNIVVAKLMSVYLISTVERLAQQGASRQTSNQSSYRTSFRNSCTYRLCNRIDQMIREAQYGQAKTAGGANLPACLNLYEQEQNKIAKFLESMGIKPKVKTSRTKASNIHGIVDGDKAGKEISLDTQISGGKNKQAAIGRG